MPGAADPFAAITDAARRQRAAKDGDKAMRETMTKLVLSRDPRDVFFSCLAMGLKQRQAYELPGDPEPLLTAATDGRYLYYNPEFWAKLAPQERMGVLAHEVMHCALNHFCRQLGRDSERWNIACDLAINEELVRSGLKLPPGACIPGVGPFAKFPKGLNAERYYDMIPPKPSGGGGGAGKDPGGCGGVIPAQDEADEVQIQAKWQVATAQAREAAKQAGTLSADLERIAAGVIDPPLAWPAILRRFVQLCSKNDYTWLHANRRHIARGLYLPSARSEDLGRVVITVDTSGSIDEKTLAQFSSEAQAVLDAFPCQVELLYHDVDVAHVQEWASDDGPITFEPKGGGGTSHCPVFERIAEGDPPTCVICLTDAYTVYPEEPPDYPVLWAVLGNADDPPWGEVLRIG